MRVLTFTSLFPNQTQPNFAVFIKNRMAAVNRRPDVEVKVVAPVPWFPSFAPGNGRWQKLSQVPAEEQVDNLTVHHPRYLVTPKVGMTLYGFFMFLGSLRRVRKIHAEWPFDLIDAHYVYPDGFAALLLGWYFKVPVVVSARGTDMNLYPQMSLVRPLIKKVLTSVNRGISVCQSLADLMVTFGADKNKVTVIPNGIEPKNFLHQDMVAARQRLNLCGSHKIVLSVGGLIERKGHHLLIEGLALLKSKNTLDFETFIIGQGPEKRNLQKQVQRHGLEKFVTLVGEVDNDKLADWYSAADLFFLGSSREGWPNVVSEALACGTPVVATAVNGIPEIIVSSVYGTVVERHPQAFAEGIERAFLVSWDREKIATYGRQRTWDVVANEVADVFNKALFQSGFNK